MAYVKKGWICGKICYDGDFIVIHILVAIM